MDRTLMAIYIYHSWRRGLLSYKEVKRLFLEIGIRL